MKKRIFAILLTLAMLLSLLPVGSLAADGAVGGKCGSNLTWTLEDGVLVISGSGAMGNYGTVNSPWQAYQQGIYALVIEPGVTVIGTAAFSGCSKLGSVFIPDSVTTIKANAFYGCGLTSMIVPASVTKIEELALGFHTQYIGEYESIQPLDGFTIYGYSGSTAESYTKQYGYERLRFVTLNPENGFYDVWDTEATHWYYDPVSWAVANEITTGTSQVAFSPDDFCTRAQAVTFLWRANGEPQAENKSNPFTDVPEGSYYHDAVLWAVDSGITTGTTASTFSPEETCTRAMVTTFIWRNMGKPEVMAESNPFEDIDNGAYYYDAVLWADQWDITNGIGNGRFDPNGNCTRAHIVTFLCRAFEEAVWFTSYDELLEWYGEVERSFTVDMDNDGVAELFVETGAYESLREADIYTMEDGVVIYLATVDMVHSEFVVGSQHEVYRVKQAKYHIGVDQIIKQDDELYIQEIFPLAPEEDIADAVAAFFASHGVEVQWE